MGLFPFDKGSCPNRSDISRPGSYPVRTLGKPLNQMTSARPGIGASKVRCHTTRRRVVPGWRLAGGRMWMDVAAGPMKTFEHQTQAHSKLIAVISRSSTCWPEPCNEWWKTQRLHTGATCCYVLFKRQGHLSGLTIPACLLRKLNTVEHMHVDQWLW